MKISHILLYIGIILALTSCQAFQNWSSTPTPMPGWDSFVAETLIDPSSFPEGWICIRDVPYTLFSDSMVNHVYRSWGQNHKGSGFAYQTVWRSYTLQDGEQWFDQLKHQQFQFSREAREDLLLDFKSPDDIRFESLKVDEYYLACGWYRSAYCELVARYENYNMDFRIDLKMDYHGQHSDGLSPEQIETLFNSADSKFSEYLTKIKTSSP